MNIKVLFHFKVSVSFYCSVYDSDCSGDWYFPSEYSNDSKLELCFKMNYRVFKLVEYNLIILLYKRMPLKLLSLRLKWQRLPLFVRLKFLHTYDFGKTISIQLENTYSVLFMNFWCIITCRFEWYSGKIYDF